MFIYIKIHIHIEHVEIYMFYNVITATSVLLCANNKVVVSVKQSETYVSGIRFVQRETYLQKTKRCV